MRYREPAICLRTTDYSETSQVVVFLTRGQGIVHLLAKGTKRPKSKSGGAIDLMSEGDLVYSHGGGEAMGTLLEFSESVSRGPLRRKADALNAALYMLELTGAMFREHDAHPEVFDLLHNTLVRLGQPDAPTQAVLAYFQWRLLRRAGLLGDFYTCVACGKAADAAGRREAYFTSAQGGLLCATCEAATAEKFRLDGATLAGLAAVAAAEGGQKVSLPPAQATAVNRLLAYHIREQLGKELRMARYAIPRPTSA